MRHCITLVIGLACSSHALAYDAASIRELLSPTQVVKGGAVIQKMSPTLANRYGAMTNNTVIQSPNLAQPELGTTIKKKTTEEKATSFNLALQELLKDCRARTAYYRSEIRRRTIRAETVSWMGGLIGVVGTVATCPHCAALASGLAGLANPLQQTFRDNHDTPDDARIALKELSISVNTELANLLNKPPLDPNSSDFECDYMDRVFRLTVINENCAYYADEVDQSASEKENVSKTQ